MANYNIIYAIEKDKSASETYTYNHPQTKIYNTDIKTITDLNSLTSKKIDGIIGGPPCQGYSINGNRDPKDPRNSLFTEYRRFVEYYQPLFFVMENVPGILTMKNKQNILVKDIILEEFHKIGYNTFIIKLNSADYGVPQKRKRIFFTGIRKDIPYHPNKLTPPKKITDPQDYITVHQAIMDLPQIQAKQGTRFQKYPIEAQNDYQKYCRKNSKGIYNHIAMKHTTRIIERFKNIAYEQSVADVKQEHQQRKRGAPDKISNKTYKQNNYRVHPNKPAPTITASFQSSFIHPYLNRNFTAREARLQSYQDNYIFKGKRTSMSWDTNLSQYQQIGNSVPPLLAKNIAETIKTYLKENIK